MIVLNKSQALCFLQCPYKWKRICVDGAKSEPSPAQTRGINIHKKIENYYKNPIQDEDIKHFIEFDKKRIAELPKDKLSDLYAKPLFQELTLFNEDIGLKGTCDAVFINPKDDELIVMDWKTGKHYGNGLDDYRFELCVYAELVNHSGKIDKKIKYIAIYFVDLGELYIEEIKEEDINKMYDTMNQVRRGIGWGVFEPKKNQWCFNCQFKKECYKKK